MNIKQWENTFKDLRDVSTLATLGGAAANLLGFKELGLACSQLKLPLLGAYLGYKSIAEKNRYKQLNYAAGSLLVWGNVFELVSGYKLGTLIKTVGAVQGTVTIACLAGVALRGSYEADNVGKRVNLGAMFVRRSLTLVAGTLQVYGFSPTTVNSTKLAEGAIGTFRVIWSLEICPKFFPI